MIVIYSKKYNIRIAIPREPAPIVDSKDYLADINGNLVDSTFPGDAFSSGDLIFKTKRVSYIFYRVNAAFDFPHRILDLIRRGENDICVIIDLDQLNPQIGFEMEDFLVMERREN